MTQSQELREVLGEVERVYGVNVTTTPKQTPRSRSRYDDDQADWHPRRPQASEQLLEGDADERARNARIAAWRN